MSGMVQLSSPSTPYWNCRGSPVSLQVGKGIHCSWWLGSSTCSPVSLKKRKKSQSASRPIEFQAFFLSVCRELTSFGSCTRRGLARHSDMKAACQDDWHWRPQTTPGHRPALRRRRTASWAEILGGIRSRWKLFEIRPLSAAPS